MGPGIHRPCRTSPDVHQHGRFLRSVGLPSFPFPGRDSNRKTDLIEGPLPRGSILLGGTKTLKDPTAGFTRNPSRASFGMQRIGQRKIPGKPYNDIHPVPGRTPRPEDHGGSGFARNFLTPQGDLSGSLDVSLNSFGNSPRDPTGRTILRVVTSGSEVHMELGRWGKGLTPLPPLSFRKVFLKYYRLQPPFSILFYT